MDLKVHQGSSVQRKIRTVTGDRRNHVCTVGLLMLALDQAMVIV